MASSAYWAADSIAQSMEAGAARARSNHELKTAERYHRGSIAQLTAALAALRQLDPAHPLTHWRVQDRIDRIGQTEARTFAQVRNLKIDINDVLAQVAGEFEAERFAALKKLDSLPVKHKRRGWWWARRDAYFFAGSTELPSRAAAEQLKGRAAALLKSADLDDEIGVERVIQMAAAGREWARPDPPPILQRVSFRAPPPMPEPFAPAPAPLVAQRERQAPVQTPPAQMPRER